MESLVFEESDYLSGKLLFRAYVTSTLGSVSYPCLGQVLYHSLSGLLTEATKIFEA